MDINEALKLLAAAADVRATPVAAGTFRTDDGTLIHRSRVARTPTPANVAADLRRYPTDHVLYIVEKTTPSLEAIAADDARVIVVSEADQSVWFNRRVTRDPKPVAKLGKGPKPYGVFAVARVLLSWPEPLVQTRLAAASGVSQSSVSNVLTRLGDLVTKSSRGWAPADAATLLDYTLTEYPGPGGVTTYWWSDLPLTGQADAVGDAGTFISGDLAASHINGWRIPEHATVYTRAGIDPTRHGFAAADSSDYTLSVTIPDDLTVFATAADGYADPVLTMFDVLHTGTTGDQGEAADKVRQVVLAAHN